MSGRGGKFNIERKFVSRKVKVVRWKPSTAYNDRSNIFLTGSWDDEVNNVSVWHLSEVDGDPTLIQEVNQPHDVNDIQFITRDVFATGLGDGGVQIYQHRQADNHIERLHLWKNLHKLKLGPVACTCLASNGEQIVSVGEDGKIFILNPESENPIKIIDCESDCSNYAAVFVKAAELLTGNMQGHLNLWDLRAQNPLRATLLSPDQVSVKHLSSHPTQQHLIAAGGGDGALSLWDMRSTSQPFVLIAAHNGPISEVQFHPSSSEHLFTCGIDGKVLHWDASASSRAALSHIMKHTKDSEDSSVKNGLQNVWFSSDVKQGLVDAVSLIPTSRLAINSLNIVSETLLAGSDTESIYIIKNVLQEF